MVSKQSKNGCGRMFLLICTLWLLTTSCDDGGVEGDDLSDEVSSLLPDGCGGDLAFDEYVDFTIRSLVGAKNGVYYHDGPVRYSDVQGLTTVRFEKYKTHSSMEDMEDLDHEVWQGRPAGVQHLSGLECLTDLETVIFEAGSVAAAVRKTEDADGEIVDAYRRYLDITPLTKLPGLKTLQLDGSIEDANRLRKVKADRDKLRRALEGSKEPPPYRQPR